VPSPRRAWLITRTRLVPLISLGRPVSQARLSRAPGTGSVCPDRVLPLCFRSCRSPGRPDRRDRAKKNRSDRSTRIARSDRAEKEKKQFSVARWSTETVCSLATARPRLGSPHVVRLCQSGFKGTQRAGPLLRRTVSASPFLRSRRDRYTIEGVCPRARLYCSPRVRLSTDFSLYFTIIQLQVLRGKQDRFNLKLVHSFCNSVLFSANFSATVCFGAE
jgi:hypothetical protein